MVAALVFTAVPPSSNPSSKLNHDLKQTLSDQLHVTLLDIQKGRFRFAPTAKTPSYSKWPTLLSTGKSIRYVVAELDNVKANDTVETIATKMEERLAGISKETILNVYESFGNVFDSNTKEMTGSPTDGPTFNLGCRRWACSVIDKDALSTLQLSHELRRVVAQGYGWKPHYRAQHGKLADMEMQVILHGHCVLLELVLLVVPPTSVQGDLPKPGCKRVEAWMLVQSAGIEEDDVVLDPLCGKGTFLVEGATTITTGTTGRTKFIGVDQSLEQLADAQENIKETRTHDRIELHHGDARKLSFLDDSSVNVILTCPPFGKQFGQGTNLELFYGQCLTEWMRVLAMGGRVAILIDIGNAEAMIHAMKNTGVLQLQIHREPFRLGRLEATVLVATKTTSSDNVSVEPATVLPWEGLAPATRATWTRLRAATLPNLVPYKSGDRGAEHAPVSH